MAADLFRRPRHLPWIAAALVLTPFVAAAQVDCSTLPNRVFVPGTTDVQPFLSRIAPALAAATGTDQLTIVYQPLGSCSAIQYIAGSTTLTGSATYWTGNVTPGGAPEEATCTFPAGAVADLALSDVTVQTCTGAATPTGVGEFSSLVQPFGFVVPLNATQQAITATEAYFIFKFGAQAGYQVPPWTNPNLIVIRTPSASTQLLIGLASGVPGTLFSSSLTNINTGSGAVITKVAAENTTGNASSTLGILSAQRYDGNRDKLRMLAFQSFQQCLGAVYPDSSATAFDKRNVRDGHYSIWGYLWAVTRTADGQPTNATVRRLIDFIGGTTAINAANPIEAAARSGAVPACAMTVRRAYDGGPFERYDAPAPCGCYFESLVGNASGCEACPAGTCANGKICRFGYCEAR